MRRRTSTTIAATTALALMISIASVDRAEARRWGWGIGAGIATALILGGIYRHHRYYYGGYYRPRYAYYGYRPYSVIDTTGRGMPSQDTDIGAPVGVITTIGTVIGIGGGKRQTSDCTLGPSQDHWVGFHGMEVSETMNSGSRILIRYGNGQRLGGYLLAIVNASASNVSSATF